MHNVANCQVFRCKALNKEFILVVHIHVNQAKMAIWQEMNLKIRKVIFKSQECQTCSVMYTWQLSQLGWCCLAIQPRSGGWCSYMTIIQSSNLKHAQKDEAWQLRDHKPVVYPRSQVLIFQFSIRIICKQKGIE